MSVQERAQATARTVSSALNRCASADDVRESLWKLRGLFTAMECNRGGSVTDGEGRSWAEVVERWERMVRVAPTRARLVKSYRVILKEISPLTGVLETAEAY